MRERDSFKKRFDKNPNALVWSQYKMARNEVNNRVKKTKQDYFMERINTAKNDLKKTWRLLNGLTSCKTGINSNVKAIKHEGAELTSLLDIANTFNNYFTTIVISKKISSSIRALKRVRGLIDRETAIKVYKGFIEPYFSYFVPVWDRLGKTLSDRLKKLQSRAARVITRSTYMTFHLVIIT